MRTLIIGATGFAGRNLARRLRELGHEVSGLARSEASAKTIAEAGLGVVTGNVAEPESIVPALANVDAVFFAPRVDAKTEMRAVQVILGAMEGTGKRFIFTSGTGVFTIKTGGEWHEANYAEDDEFVRAPLAGERVDIENVVRAAANRGIHGTVVRPPMIWGHGSQRTLSALHGSARSGAVCYLGRGLNVMSGIHVDDLADIYALTLTKGVSGALYHAVSGETSWRAFAAEVARLRGLPTRSVDIAEAEELFGNVITHIVFSCCNRSRCPRTRSELGWSPNPNRVDIFAELAHPSFMNATGPNSDLDKYFKKAHG
jgi:nucleoside-diphosphate-sugar epimerase